MMERAFSEALATEGTEFTERFSLSPSTRQPLLQPGCVEMGKNVRLCVLGDLCGRTFLTSPSQPSRPPSFPFALVYAPFAVGKNLTSTPNQDWTRSAIAGYRIEGLLSSLFPLTPSHHGVRICQPRPTTTARNQTSSRSSLTVRSAQLHGWGRGALSNSVCRAWKMKPFCCG